MDGGIEPASYSLSLTSIDGIKELFNISLATSFTQDMNKIILSVNQPLPHRRLWNYQILALGCVEHPITNSLRLSKSS